MNHEKNEQENGGHQPGQGRAGEELQPVNWEHVGGQFAALDQRRCSTLNGAEHDQVGLLAIESEESSLRIVSHRETGSVDEGGRVKPVRFAITNDQQVAVAGIVQIRDADRRDAADQAVEVHALLNGVGFFPSGAAVPFHAGDGPGGFTQQDEALVARVGLGFCLLNALRHERRPADVR